MLMYTTKQSTFAILADLTKKVNALKPASRNLLKRSFQLELLQSPMPRSKTTNSSEDPNPLIFTYRHTSTIPSNGGASVASGGGGVIRIWEPISAPPSHDMASHSDSVHTVTFSGDGQMLASGSLDNTVKIWDPSTGLCLHTFSHSNQITSVAFSPDSAVLASGTRDRTIRIWDTHTHDLISSFNTRESSKSLGFSPNGTQLVSVGHSPGAVMDLDLWEVATGKPLASMKVDSTFQKVAFGVDGTSVVLENMASAMRWRISPTQSTRDDNNNNCSSLPMEFVPLNGTQLPVSSRFYHYQEGAEWIIDEQNRRVLWIPPDLRRVVDCYGKKVAFGSPSGMVTIVDISNVRY